jgi:hypothetical protein
VWIGVLREIRPALIREDDVWEWYQLAVKPIIVSAGHKKAVFDDALEFLSAIMAYDEDETNAQLRSQTSDRICDDLIGIYLSRTREVTEDDSFLGQDNGAVTQQIESVLVAFGKKMPKRLFQHVDDLTMKPSTRLQGLTLLSTFLQHQSPHLYQVIHTPLVDHLLKCLINDTSTTVLSVALTSLIMLLPHIPTSLPTRLPRLFLIYSRLLCWERFSTSSTDAQKSLVTDDRISSSPYDHEDVGVDPTWEKCGPPEGAIDSATPEVKTYFTYLYGLYPLNLMSYLRKPRRYLKNADFPNADDFDLDQNVIRSRSDQFRQVHVLHANFYHLTIEEELTDSKWLKMDPSDVVAECQSLAISAKPLPLSPGRPPTGKLPDLPSVPLLPSSHNGSVSPAPSHTSLRSGNSWRDTHSTAVDPESPILGPDDSNDLLRPRSKAGVERAPLPSSVLDEFPMPEMRVLSPRIPSTKQDPQTNLAYFQREITLLRNELNFERWHKSQYSQHIGQLLRKNIKDATVEAETLNLINANRALKQQLEQARSAREATIKDSNLTRKQANNLEANMTERFNKLKKEQETWASDADELRKLRAEMKTYRDLLSQSEARELRTSHDLEIAKRHLEQLAKLEAQLGDARNKLKQYEYREWDFDQAKREQEMLQNEKETLSMRIRRQEQDLDRTKRMYSDRITELEAQLSSGGGRGSYDRLPASHSATAGGAVQQELDDMRERFESLKKAHSRLLERYTDLELDYQAAKSHLARVSSYDGDHDHPESRGRGPSVVSSALADSVYEMRSEYGAPSELAYSNISKSDPTHKHQFDHMRGLPLSPASTGRSEPVVHSHAGLTWKPPATSYSARAPKMDPSEGGSLVFHRSASLAPDERSVMSGQSSDSAGKRLDKIKPDSEIRVYGRGKW